MKCTSCEQAHRLGVVRKFGKAITCSVCLARSNGVMLADLDSERTEEEWLVAELQTMSLHNLAEMLRRIATEAKVALCTSGRVGDNQTTEGMRTAMSMIQWVLLKVAEGHEAIGFDPATARPVAPSGHHPEFETLIAGAIEQLASYGVSSEVWVSPTREVKELLARCYTAFARMVNPSFPGCKVNVHVGQRALSARKAQRVECAVCLNPYKRGNFGTAACTECPAKLCEGCEQDARATHPDHRMACMWVR